MAITTEQVKELRDKTGVSVMQCKKALEEAEGDMEKALLILKKKSAEIAAKKSDREAAAGFIASTESTGKGCMLVLKCETDFVAQNADFTTLAQTLVQELGSNGKDAVTNLASEKIPETIQKVGENIQLGEMVEVIAPIVGTYVHDGRVAAMVGLEGGSQELAKDIAMHITAMNPEYKDRSEVPSDMESKVRAMFEEEVASSGKPADIQEKMLSGKIDTFFKERTLMDQAFIKNPEKSIATLLKEAGATLVDFKRLATA